MDWQLLNRLLGAVTPLVQILALPLSNCVVSLCLGFFFCKMGLGMALTSESFCVNEMRGDGTPAPQAVWKSPSPLDAEQCVWHRENAQRG